MAAAPPPASVRGPVRAGGLDAGFSVHLDLIRFLAASVVFLSHACKPGFADGVVPNLVAQGTDAVTVFFVLSGLVVAYVAETKDATFADYLVSRLARLWSVGIPAMLLSAAFFAIGNTHDPGLYTRTIIPDIGAEHLSTLHTGAAFHALRWLHLQAIALAQSGAIARFLICGLFLNESWGLSVIAFHNPPYWSLGYEFWYYILFGCCIYLRGWRRVAAAGLGAVIAGPKILLLMPIWLMGVALYHARTIRSRRLAVAMAVSPVPLYLLLAASGMFAELTALDRYIPCAWLWSSDCLRKYLVASLVCLGLAGLKSLAGPDVPPAATRLIRFLASRTLSLYLFHLPLMCVVSALLPAGMPPVARGVTIMASTLGAVFCLAVITEDQRGAWRAALNAARAWAMRGRGDRAHA